MGPYPERDVICASRPCAALFVMVVALTLHQSAVFAQTPARNFPQQSRARTAPDKPAVQTPGAIRVQTPQVSRWEIGVTIKARGACTGITASMPVPHNWPEQQVKIVDQKKSSHVRNIRHRKLDQGVTQMIVTIPRLPAGQTAEVLVTYEVTKSVIVEPAATDDLRASKRLPISLRKYLLPSPSIQSRDPRIVKLSGEIVSQDQPAWKKVEMIFDWVRDNIEYKFDRQLRGALVALDRRVGDCEEMTSLFVALCRAQSIPARSVWIPQHCYPEFYLEDSKGNGHWYPCQAAGTRAFGAMPEYRPILQKGDNFKVAGKREAQRYVAEMLSAKNVVSNPEVSFVRRKIQAGTAGR